MGKALIAMRTSDGVNTLVIGGGGYIGFHLVPLLLKTGRNVTVLDRNLVPHYALPVEASYIAGDFGDLSLLEDLLDTHREVIHLAYATIPNTSFENPLADLLQNLPPAVQLFIEVAKRNCRLVLVSSGGTIYGQAKVLPIPEEHTTRPISPYGVTKLTLEKYANLYSVTHGLDVVCVRPANAYGPGQRPFHGQGFIATAIASALKRKTINIFGQFGTVRDYVYVTDIAAGIVAAMIDGHSGEVYNIGSGQGFSNMDIVKKLEPMVDAAGGECRVEHLPERVFDVRENVLDITKIVRQTAWSPQVDFDTGLKLAFDWIKTNFED